MNLKWSVELLTTILIHLRNFEFISYICFRAIENHTLKVIFYYKGYFVCDPIISYKKSQIHEFRGK